MGEVYLCLDLAFAQPIALKTFQARHLDTPGFREAFNKEVMTWVALEKHPNIVRCSGAQVLDSQLFMLLEWIASEESVGSDLRGWLSGGPLGLRLALSFTIDLCRGLDHAVSKQPGIVHRDLKPENVLVAQGPIAKITDWGLAEIVHDANLDCRGEPMGSAIRQSLLGFEGIVGTPPYMAPEQWVGEKLDARTDIYALGCVLYEMLTGSRPFTAGSIDDLRCQHLQGCPPELPGSTKITNVLNQAVSRCLAKRRGDRFAQGARFAR